MWMGRREGELSWCLLSCTIGRGWIVKLSQNPLEAALLCAATINPNENIRLFSQEDLPVQVHKALGKSLS